MLKPYNRINTFLENTEIFQCELPSRDFYNENLLFWHKTKAIQQYFHQIISTFFQPERFNTLCGYKPIVTTYYAVFLRNIASKLLLLLNDVVDR